VHSFVAIWAEILLAFWAETFKADIIDGFLAFFASHHKRWWSGICFIGCKVVALVRASFSLGVQLLVTVIAQPLITLCAVSGNGHLATTTLTLVALVNLHRHSFLVLLALLLALAFGFRVVIKLPLMLSTLSLLVDLFIALSTHPQTTFVAVSDDFDLIALALAFFTLQNVVW